MIAVDTNILVYAHRLDTAQNSRAFGLVNELMIAAAPWAIPWTCIHEFLGVVTRTTRWQNPTPIEAALDQVETWRSSPTLTLLAELDGYWNELRSLTLTGRVAGPKIHDARIAAVCLTNGVRELWSADRDFSRFPGLRVVNPLIG